MFQFGEILTLALSLITLVYLLAYRRRIRAEPALRAFVGPFLILMVAFVATVAEGAFMQGADIPVIVFGQENISIAHAGTASEWLNLIEHTSYALSAIWLYVAIWRLYKRPRETPA
ncbi:MAG: hypothetical protein NT049_05800 [Planctomycetota bacterium]|nr:hypothetical protein [Planctomycetota bacterium]